MLLVFSILNISVSRGTDCDRGIVDSYEGLSNKSVTWKKITAFYYVLMNYVYRSLVVLVAIPMKLCLWGNDIRFSVSLFVSRRNECCT